MKKNKDTLGIFLALVTGGVLLIAMLVRAFLPRIILPAPDGIAIVLLSLAALVLEHYVTRGNPHRDFRLIPLYGVLIFGLFPWAACFVPLPDVLWLAVLGGVMFTVVTFLFDTLTDRLSSGPAAKVAPLVSGFGLYLAAQCLTGIV